MATHKSYWRSQGQRELIKNCAQRYNFFNNKIAKECNALPDQIINSETETQFKAFLDLVCHILLTHSEGFSFRRSFFTNITTTTTT